MKLNLKDDLVPVDSLEVRERFGGELAFRTLVRPEYPGQPIVLKHRKVAKLRDALNQWLEEQGR